MLRSGFGTWGLAAALLVLATGCGSSSTDDAKSNGGSGGAPGTKPTEGPPANAVGGFKATFPPQQVAPGEDLYPCWVIPLELTGPSHMIAGAVMHTTLGLHHGNVTTRPITPGVGMRPCAVQDPFGEALDVIHGGAVLFGSTTQLVGDEWRHFPDGMAYKIKDGYEIVARMHYLNPTEQEVTVDTSYEWFTVPEAGVSMEIGPMFWQITGFEIPARQETTLATDCYFVKPMQIVEAMPHMHSLGTNFTISYLGGSKDGQTILSDKGYNPDGAIRDFTPPIDLSQADGVHFSCTWNNTRNVSVKDGGSGKDEMCMMFGYGYPAANAYTATSAGSTHCAAILPP